MSEVASVPASFINLDLELESSGELVALEEELARGAYVLYSGPTPGGYRLALEPLIQGLLNADPLVCTEHFLSRIEALRPAAQAVFRVCRSRVFDYGFDGGLEANPIRTDLSSSTLARMAALGIDVRITTYPYRGPGPEEAE
jgi:hypothetical protein